MAFKDIPGAGRIKRTLKLALSRGRVPNSLLFTGPEGVGKRRTALTLAKALNCREMSDDSCDRCSSCLAIDGGRFPDVMEIETAEDKAGVAIEQIRLLKHLAYLRPMAGRKRVFIVSAAEEMSEAAENSVLKVLEEPPLFSHIILVTASPFLLLPTIVSRCRTLAFAPVRREEIERILVERDYPEDRARVLSLLVGGNLERALELEWDEVQELKEESWTLLEGLLSGRNASLFLDRFGGLAKSALEPFRETMEILASFVRDMVLLKTGGEGRFLLNPDFEDRLREAAGSATVPRLLGLLAEMDFVLTELPKNLNKNLLAAAFLSNFGELRHV